jgi:hypothetical protein
MIIKLVGANTSDEKGSYLEPSDILGKRMSDRVIRQSKIHDKDRKR